MGRSLGQTGAGFSEEHGDGHSVGCGDPRATWHQVRLKRHPEPGGTGLSGGR